MFNSLLLLFALKIVTFNFQYHYVENNAFFFNQYVLVKKKSFFSSLIVSVFILYNLGTKCSYIPPNTSISAMSKEESNFMCNPFVRVEFVKKMVGDDEGKLLL